MNGQGTATTPHALARACLAVGPSALSPMDWRYNGGAESYTVAQTTTTGGVQFESASLTFNLTGVEPPEWAVGSLFGELWLTWADSSGLTSGEIRMTPKAQATLGPDTFVHATMEVEVLTTGRRYPQVSFIDSSTPPSTLIVETLGGITTPVEVVAELCQGVAWDEGVQCPAWDLQRITADAGLRAPHLEINGIQSDD